MVAKFFSFLNKLLDFTNINKDNLHKIFSDIINRIKHSFINREKKEPVRKLLKHIEGEWSDEKQMFCDENCGCMDNVGKYITESSKTDEFVKNIEQKISEKHAFSKLIKEEDMGEYSNIELLNMGEDSLKICEIGLKEMNKDLTEINNELEKINGIDLDFILDLSLKHVELYECFDDEKKILNEKIHNIFLNYAIMISLLKKQYSHTRHIILEIKSKILENCEFIKRIYKTIFSNKKPII